MSRILDTLLSSIAPHECVACGTTGQLLCRTCQHLLPEARSQCYKCMKPTVHFRTCTTCIATAPLTHVFVATPYETIAKTLVRGLKFERTYAAAATIAQAANSLVGAQLPENALFCHVPTATSRVRQRGYDQSQLIARSLARYRGSSYASMLWRHGQERQTGNGRTERLSQLQHAFSVRVIPSCPVVLVDDVMTTGASLEAAATALRAAGVPSVSGIVFARAE